MQTMRQATPKVDGRTAGIAIICCSGLDLPWRGLGSVERDRHRDQRRLEPRPVRSWRRGSSHIARMETEDGMSVARVTKITAASPKSFDDALRNGAERAAKTIRGITGLHVIEQKAKVEGGKITEFRVTMEVTFILEE